jgi:hypothetical protein
MNARPPVKEILIARKLQRWSAISKCPLVDLRCPPARAMKELLAFVPSLQGNCVEDWPARVVGVLAAKHSPSKSARIVAL